MKIKELTKEQLENMSHMDIVYYIIKKNNKTYKTIDLLKELCNLLSYDNNVFESLIGDFYTQLNLDKRFILINGVWDISEKHIVNVIVEDELDEYDEEEIDEEKEEDELESETEDDAVLDDTDALTDVEDDLEDDLENLTIVDEEDLDEENNDSSYGEL